MSVTKNIPDKLRPLYIRFQDCFQHYKHGNRKPKFAQHLLDNKHSTGSMENITEILHITRKCKMMNTLERFHIYNEAKLDNQINDKCTVKPNIIFDMIIQRNANRGRSTL
jgi:hypothetical protein